MPTKPKLKHLLNWRGLLSYYVLLAVLLGLFLKRADTAFWSQLPLISTYSLNSHFSNFSLSMMLMMVFGLSVLLFSTDWKLIYGWAGSLVAANLVMEFLVSVGNTTDPADAITGIIGTSLGLGFVFALQRFGLAKRTKRT